MTGVIVIPRHEESPREGVLRKPGWLGRTSTLLRQEIQGTEPLDYDLIMTGVLRQEIRGAEPPDYGLKMMGCAGI